MTENPESGKVFVALRERYPTGRVTIVINVEVRFVSDPDHL